MADSTPKAETVPAHLVKSTVKSSEKALSQGKMDIRDRDDIDKKHESPDRYFRRLEEVEGKLAALRAEKRKLLQAILAMKQGLGMPDKSILKLSDAELEGKPKPKKVKSASKPEPKPDGQ